MQLAILFGIKRIFPVDQYLSLQPEDIRQLVLPFGRADRIDDDRHFESILKPVAGNHRVGLTPRRIILHDQVDIIDLGGRLLIPARKVLYRDIERTAKRPAIEIQGSILSQLERNDILDGQVFEPVPVA